MTDTDSPTHATTYSPEQIEAAARRLIAGAERLATEFDLTTEQALDLMRYASEGAKA